MMPFWTMTKLSTNSSLGCGISVDLQKAFNTVEHDILLAKLEHYGIHGIANEWFKSYHFDRKQFVSIYDHISNKASIKWQIAKKSRHKDGLSYNFNLLGVNFLFLCLKWLL